VFPASAKRQNYLRYYSQTFNTVEGNTTFYAIPSPDTFHRWAEQVTGGFRFALKFPRIVTHEKVLQGAGTEIDLFLSGLQILQQRDCLGPTFIQFADWFGPNRFDQLAKFLTDLPKSMPFAVEVRDHAWFNEPHESRLNELLRELGMDRVIFDSRPLFSAKASDEHEVKAQARKPKSPVHPYALGDHPFLRLIGRNQVELAKPWIEEWAPVVAQWIGQGKVPFLFTHAPDDRFAPELAALFHERLAAALSDLPAMAFPNRSSQQLNLF